MSARIAILEHHNHAEILLWRRSHRTHDQRARLGAELKARHTHLTGAKASDRGRANSTIEEEPMSDPVKDLQDSLASNLALISEPTDHTLLRQAQESKGHISLKAVSDEYNSLILRRIERRRPRGLWARLFGG
jgi:hypothetical protein